MNFNAIYFGTGAALLLMFSSCSENKTAEDQLKNAKNEMAESSAEAKEDLNETFKSFKSEIVQEQNELKEELKKLKQEINEEQIKPANSSIDKILAKADKSIKNLEVKTREFEKASNNRKVQIKSEYRRLEKEAEKSLEKLKDELKEL